MSGKRQKNQLQLAFMEEYRGEAPNVLGEGTETLAVKRTVESPAIDEQWIEEVCERQNCKQALNAGLMPIGFRHKRSKNLVRPAQCSFF